jgi:hypothetical protein
MRLPQIDFLCIYGSAGMALAIKRKVSGGRETVNVAYSGL